MAKNDHWFRRFRRFRWTRPFWGGLLVIVAGLIIGYLPLGPLTVVIRAGVGGIAGFACSVILIVMGLFIWFVPAQRRAAAITAAIVSLASFPLSNFGGFVVGMMLGIVGACWAFGWVPDKGPRKSRKKSTGGVPSPPPASVPDQDVDRGSFTERV